MTTRTFFFAAALTAVASFGSAANATGDYYEGAEKRPAVSAQRVNTFGFTGAVSRAAEVLERLEDQPVDNGDWFKGASRPN